MLTIINCNFRSTKAVQFPSRTFKTVEIFFLPGSVQLFHSYITFLPHFFSYTLRNTYALSHWLPLPFPLRRTLSHRRALFEIFIAGNAKILGRKFTAAKSDQLGTG